MTGQVDSAERGDHTDALAHTPYMQTQSITKKRDMVKRSFEEARNVLQEHCLIGKVTRIRYEGFSTKDTSACFSSSLQS